MANLVSPGVSVTVTDESFYVGSGPGTVPFILLATQENKPQPTDSSVVNPDTAVGTLKSNAGSLYLISSQRELLQTFGNPIFYSEQGTPIHGSPINEYGLLAAHSYMGIANRTFVMRADIDTYQLQPSTQPLGTQVNENVEVTHPYWVDMLDVDFALYEYTVAEGWNPIDNVIYFEGAPATDPTIEEVGTYRVHREGTDWKIYFGKEATIGGWKLVKAGDDVGTGYPSDFQFSATIPTTRSVVGNNGTLEDGDTFILTNETVGFNMALSVFDNITNQYVSSDAPILTDDAEAESFYGSNLKPGDSYIQRQFSDAVFKIRSYEPDDNISTLLIWNDQDDGVGVTFDGLDPSYDRIAQLPVGLVPIADSYWHDPDPTKVDILVGGLIDDGGDGIPAWVEFDGTIFVQPTDPFEINVGDAPVENDLWVDTNESNYPAIYRLDPMEEWILIDNADSEQIIFSDVRPAPIGADGLPMEQDADTPLAAEYEAGVLLFNTRYGGLNVKQWTANHEHDGVVIGDRWVTASGLNEDGSLRSGADAAKFIVVKAMKEAIASSEDLRSESIFYNLIASPGYPELIPDMVSLNVDRKEQGFVIGDSPFDLPATGTAIQAWATNANLAPSDGDDGLVSTSPYLGVWYPGGAYTTNLDGMNVVAPSSHVMLRTMAYNDQVAYQWFAPAGLQRGPVSNATTVGYLDDEGEFVVTNLSPGLRDILYVNNINPIAFIPNRGLHVWGQKTRSPVASALDRVNVARLINYIRYQTENAAYPYLFEPNDDLTRRNVKDSMDSIMANLITLRGLTDFLVVCDESNNTPDRIDRNELWVDIAIIPTKAVEFIYIPIRIKNTGEDLGG